MVEKGSEAWVPPAGLARLLAGWVEPVMAEPRQPLADRIGQWLPFTDALALFSALKADLPMDGVAAGRHAHSGAALGAALDRLRRTIAEVIEPAPESEPSATADDSDAQFGPYERLYLDRQRLMATRIVPLRASIRATLAGQGPALRRLAALDAVLERALAARERDLLARTPETLARRFRALREASTSASEPAQTWRATFWREFQATLQAELDLRLRPVAGLLAALEAPDDGLPDLAPDSTGPHLS